MLLCAKLLVYARLVQAFPNGHDPAEMTGAAASLDGVRGNDCSSPLLPFLSGHVVYNCMIEGELDTRRSCDWQSNRITEVRDLRSEQSPA